MARHGGTGATGSPPRPSAEHRAFEEDASRGGGQQHMPASGRLGPAQPGASHGPPPHAHAHAHAQPHPSPPARSSGTQHLAPLSSEQREEWRAWLWLILEQKGWIQRLPDGSRRTYLSRLAQVLTQTVPQAPISESLLRAYAYRGSVPETGRALALAQVLGISPLAILFRSGQVSLEQLVALIGPATRALTTEAETRLRIESLRSSPMPPEWRQFLEHQFLEDLTYSRDLQGQLALSDAEFGQLRAYLSERGKEQTRRDVLGDATPMEPPAALTDEVFVPPAGAPQGVSIPFAPEHAIEPPLAQPPHARPPADARDARDARDAERDDDGNADGATGTAPGTRGDQRA